MADVSAGPGNGAMRARVGTLAAAGGSPSPYDDPMSKVWGLDAQSSSTVAWLGYGLGSIALMLGLMVAVRIVSLVVAMTNGAPNAATSAQEIDVEDAPLPPPPPPAPVPEPEPKAEPAPPPPRATPREAPPPAPAPAQAGKVLTQEPDPNEPVDLTGNTIVTGNSDAYAGGTTTSNGTSKTAVRSLASPNGVPGATGAPRAAPVAPGPDLSRKASPLNHDWNAPFPPEADVAQIDEALVTLQVDVRADGTLAAARVVKDPGNGFGRAARQYAMTQRFQATLDHDGNAIPSTISVIVHFSR